MFAFVPIVLITVHCPCFIYIYTLSYPQKNIIQGEASPFRALEHISEYLSLRAVHRCEPSVLLDEIAAKDEAHNDRNCAASHANHVGIAV